MHMAMGAIQVLRNADWVGGELSGEKHNVC